MQVHFCELSEIKGEERNGLASFQKAANPTVQCSFSVTHTPQSLSWNNGKNNECKVCDCSKQHKYRPVRF